MSPTLAVNILGLKLFVASPTSTICTDGKYVPIAAILVLVVEIKVKRAVRVDEGGEYVPTEMYVHTDIHVAGPATSGGPTSTFSMPVFSDIAELDLDSVVSEVVVEVNSIFTVLVDVDADVESVIPIRYTDETKAIDSNKMYSIILVSSRQSISLS